MPLDFSSTTDSHRCQRKLYFRTSLYSVFTDLFLRLLDISMLRAHLQDTLSINEYYYNRVIQPPTIRIHLFTQTFPAIYRKTASGTA